ncbi:MAG: hypothetical protein ACM3PP_08445 [Candidatus Saccharibacteria bacterium]
MKDRSGLEKEIVNDANWFLGIAVLAIVSCWALVYKGDTTTALNLGVTRIVNDIWAARGPGLTMAVTAFFSVIYMIIGLAARKKKSPAFVIGLLIYALDAVALMRYSDYLSLIFHALVLFNLYWGLSACRSLQAVSEETPGEPETGGN